MMLCLEDEVHHAQRRIKNMIGNAIGTSLILLRSSNNDKVGRCLRPAVARHQASFERFATFSCCVDEDIAPRLVVEAAWRPPCRFDQVANDLLRNLFLREEEDTFPISYLFQDGHT
jgi:hypothetical protein